MRLGAFCLTASMTLFATGCGGGGASTTLPSAPAPGGPSSTSQGIRATAKLVIPPAPSSSSLRRPLFVSASTNGVQVVTFAHSDTNHTTALATVVTNVSSGSSACTPASGAGRTCNVGVQGPAGSDDFVFSLYDAAPVSGAIPGTAHLLGTAGITQTLTASTANVVAATIGGVITGLSGQAANLSVPGDGSNHNIGIMISATDFGNNTITGTTGNYANPITVAVTEHGGTGHATVQLNGGTGAASVQATKSSDTVQVVYDGQGSPGYYVSVALTAAAVNSQGGATEGATISPLLLSSTSTDYTQASASVGMKGNGDLVPFTVSEAGTAGTPTYTFTRGTHCPAVGLLQTLSGTTFNILALGVASTYAAGTGCAITVSDGTSTVTLGVSNTFTHTCCTTTFSDFTTGNASAGNTSSVAIGSDGNMWFTDCGGYIYKVATNATSSAGVTTYTVPLAAGVTTVHAIGANPGPDGNVWFADCDSTNNVIGKITPSGTVNIFNATPGSANQIVAGPDGKMWFSNDGNSVGTAPTSSGTPTFYGSGTISSNGITEGPDGNLWFTDGNNNAVGKITPSGTPTEYTAGITASAGPFGIVAGPDGALWFTESCVSKIGRITTSGAVTEYATATPGESPYSITVGQDGALWYLEDTTPLKIGRITTAGVATEYTLNTGTSTNGWQLAAGPDGAIWFSECGAHKIGRMSF